MCIAGARQRLADAFPAARLVAILRDPGRPRRTRTTAWRCGAVRRHARSTTRSPRCSRAPTRSRPRGRRRRSARPTSRGASTAGCSATISSASTATGCSSPTPSDARARSRGGAHARSTSSSACRSCCPTGLGERYHVGGSRAPVPERATPAAALTGRMGVEAAPAGHAQPGVHPLRPLEREARGHRRRGRARAPRWSAETEARLREHFAADERRLAETHGVALPWHGRVGPGANEKMRVVVVPSRWASGRR